MQAFVNPAVQRHDGSHGLFDDAEYRDVHAYYAVHPELAWTPLHSLPALAASAGIGSFQIKDESARHGLNAFKVMGVRYAVHRIGDEAAARGLVCATTGNHGRAVARVAREKRVPCTIFVPAPRTGGAHPAERQIYQARIAAMQADGATTVEVDGTYEQAVARAAEHGASHGATVLSDTSWPGYEQIPRWIMAGYTQIFEEAYAKWDHRPDVILVQGGVGGLVCAAASWVAWRFGAGRPFVVACEPDGAACLLASAAAGHATRLAHAPDTIMAGLRCAEPSFAAWPAIQDGVDAFVSVPDRLAVAAMERLASPAAEDPKVMAGPSGACGVAALLALTGDPGMHELRRALDIGRSTRALAVVTEGP